MIVPTLPPRVATSPWTNRHTGMSPTDATRFFGSGAAPTNSESVGFDLDLVTGLVAFFAGLLTAFTVSVVGEMPVGELVLFAVAGWVVLNVLVTRHWPCALLRHKLFWILLGAQMLALGAYVFSDLYCGSSTHDIARGWGRMVFLSVDLLAMAYLAGCSTRNISFYLIGQLAGDFAHSIFFGALFGDWWKFGAGIPVTYLLFALAIRGGPYLTVCVAFGMALFHLMLDFRSFGGICVLVGVLTGMQLLPRTLRPWLAPAILVASLGGFLVYQQIHQNDAHRSTRSDVSRSAMMIAAWEAIERHPLTGNGSWFSHSDVWDNFMIIRRDRARLAHVGGFPEANEDPGTVAFHTQILVSLAEGGFFGGTFFIVFGSLLVHALYSLAFTRLWRRHYPIFGLVLVTALWNVFFSPFSGAHRVYIAAACGVLLLFYTEGDRPDFNPRRISR